MIDLSTEERRAMERAALPGFPRAAWLAARDYYRADSQATMRMFADALKELADWAEDELVSPTTLFANWDRGYQLLHQARAILDEPVETQEQAS
jgi:hypothetical protein